MGAVMQTKFNHAANDSPRSGRSSQAAPAAGLFVVVLLIVIVIVVWFAVKP